jgi:beta-glucuronidase
MCLAACLTLVCSMTACGFPAAAGRADLPTTLEWRDVPGGVVAFQSGIPVPTFDTQPRLRLELDGTWKFDAEQLDSNLSLADRSRSLRTIKQDLGLRAVAGFDDGSWRDAVVPGTFDPPPVSSVTGGYYRRTFDVGPEWAGQYATMKFGAVRYVADVWLNGTYLGYHEGGDTSFALDASKALISGGRNTLVMRVDNPEWGTRNDIVPWGLADWWNYGGVVGDVWLEATPALSAVRADVVPHLDGADISIVLNHRGTLPADASIDVTLYPAQVTAANLTNPDALSLIPDHAGSLLDQHIDIGSLGQDSVIKVDAPFAIRGPDLWGLGSPSLYVLRIDVNDGLDTVDHLYTSFGLRQVRVDATAPRILLNGQPVVFNGVAVHEERVQPPRQGRPAGGQLMSASDMDALLRRAQQIHADLVRVDHHPPNPVLPVIADRLGIALWEEIPLYHDTPETFTIATDRKLAQQMLSELDLRDFNRPSVLFHGFANESSGLSERAAALNTLNALDHRIDGTRLTGQASYGSDPADPTSANLDVAGYTFYYGVFYGGRLSGPQIHQALAEMHRAYPKKPVMIMEFGYWADDRPDEVQQQRVFTVTYGQMAQDFATRPGGFVAAAVWWSLDDYWTQRPGLVIESFGLYRPDGSLRPAGVALARDFAANAPPQAAPNAPSGGVAVAIQPSARHGLFLQYIAYGLAVPAAAVIALIVLLSRRKPRRAW